MSIDTVGKIKIIAVGKIKDKSLNELINYFSKMISSECRFEITEVSDSSFEGESKKVIEMIEKEQQKENCYIFILSEEGKQSTSREFSEKLKKVDRKIIFVIGGPFGMSAELKKRGNEIISLSKMTFTHEMCRLFLVEQIYRGLTIIQGRKYHHD